MEQTRYGSACLARRRLGRGLACVHGSSARVEPCPCRRPGHVALVIAPSGQRPAASPLTVRASRCETGAALHGTHLSAQPWSAARPIRLILHPVAGLCTLLAHGPRCSPSPPPPNPPWIVSGPDSTAPAFLLGTCVHLPPSTTAHSSCPCAGNRPLLARSLARAVPPTQHTIQPTQPTQTPQTTPPSPPPAAFVRTGFFVHEKSHPGQIAPRAVRASPGSVSPLSLRPACFSSLQRILHCSIAVDRDLLRTSSSHRHRTLPPRRRERRRSPRAIGSVLFSLTLCFLGPAFRPAVTAGPRPSKSPPFAPCLVDARR